MHYISKEKCYLCYLKKVFCPVSFSIMYNNIFENWITEVFNLNLFGCTKTENQQLNPFDLFGYRKKKTVQIKL